MDFPAQLAQFPSRQRDAPSDWGTAVKKLAGFLRLLAALAILSAVIGHFVFTAGRATINPLNSFGYFLIRGATDGWEPYPFLDPATGYGSVTTYRIAISAITVVFGPAVFGLSRVRILAE